MTLFDKAVEHVVDIEGGVSNDPADPGGLTKYGISQRAYPDVDILALTKDDAKAIYRRDYWDALRCDALPPAVAVIVFDCGVNQGIRRAAVILQVSLGVDADGILGPVTLRAAHKADSDDLCADILARRAMHYAGLDTFERFGRGWLRRLFFTQQFAMKET